MILLLGYKEATLGLYLVMLQQMTIYLYLWDSGSPGWE